MTNPTPPLTAEEALKEIYKACDYGDSHGKSAVEWLNDYAAQQNAEMVAENEYLKRLLSRMSWYANIPNATGIDEVDDKRDKEWEESQNALDGMKKGPFCLNSKPKSSG
jgi:hypothetical protein